MMKDPYMEVFEEIGIALQKQSEMIIELARTCLTIKQYEAFAQEIDEKINKKQRYESIIDSLKKQ